MLLIVYKSIRQIKIGFDDTDRTNHEQSYEAHDGRFYVLDFYSGQPVWEFEAGGAISASPAVAAGRVVVGTQDGRLYCFG